MNENKQSITKDYFLKNFSFKRLYQGRLGRLQYFLSLLALIAAFIVVTLIYVFITDIFKNETLNIVGLVIVIGSGIIFSASLHIRRLHDMNLTGWLVLVILLAKFMPYIGPVIGLLVLLTPGTVGDNKYGKLSGKRSFLEALFNLPPHSVEE